MEKNISPIKSKPGLDAIIGFVLLMLSALAFKWASDLVINWFWPTKHITFPVAFSFLFCLWLSGKVIASAVISEVMLAKNPLSNKVKITSNDE